MHATSMRTLCTGRNLGNTSVMNVIKASRMRYHVDHHINFKVTCDLCGFQSSSLNNLAQHKLIHNSDAVEGYMCDKCSINFSNKLLYFV